MTSRCVILWGGLQAAVPPVWEAALGPGELVTPFLNAQRPPQTSPRPGRTFTAPHDVQPQIAATHTANGGQVSSEGSRYMVRAEAHASKLAWSYIGPTRSAQVFPPRLGYRGRVGLTRGLHHSFQAGRIDPDRPIPGGRPGDFNLPVGLDSFNHPGASPAFS